MPILSIVIPTKNRHRYLAQLIASLLRMESRDFEIVVHDNSEDNSEYRRLCGSLADERLRYFADPAPLAIAENCERAVSLATGTFVCMIGDDDGVLESAIDLARWMEVNGIDAAVGAKPTYLWPGVSSVLDGPQTQGILRLPRCTDTIEVRDEAAALRGVLRSGGIKMGELPSVYHGIVSRRALDALKQLSGTYFPGPSPDIANAVGVSAVIDRFASVGRPVVVSGNCTSSAAAEGARHAHEGEIADKRFLAPDTAARWPAQVPFYFSGPTLYAATVIHALSATGRAALLRDMRFERLYAACVVFNPAYRQRVAAARARVPGLVTSLGMVGGIGWIWWLRARALAGNLFHKFTAGLWSERRIAGLEDIGAVIGYLTRRFGPYRAGE